MLPLRLLAFIEGEGWLAWAGRFYIVNTIYHLPLINSIPKDNFLETGS